MPRVVQPVHGLIFGFDLGSLEALNIVEVSSDIGYLKTSWFDEETSEFDTSLDVHDAIDLFILRLFTHTQKNAASVLGTTSAHRADIVRDTFSVSFIPYGNTHTPKYIMSTQTIIAHDNMLRAIDAVDVAQNIKAMTNKLQRACKILAITPLENDPCWFLTGAIR